MGRSIFVIIILCLVEWSASAQVVVPQLSLSRALVIAETNYPLLKSKRHENEAAQKGISISKHSLVPSLDIAYQANLATANNITGMFYPTDMIPMTGPVFQNNNNNPAFGSAANLLLNWQPLTFGSRAADIQLATAEAYIRSADFQNELFKHKITVISIYLDVLLAKELLLVHQKNLERTIFNLNQSKVLVAAGLRPGVDTALFLSELSKAKINLINARKNHQAQQITLSQALVNDSFFLLTDTLPLNKIPSQMNGKMEPSKNHPLITLSQSELAWSKSKEHLLNKYWLPKLNLWATGFARGSGVYADGTIKAADGFGFTKYNYGMGIQIAFPILKFSEARLQQQQQHFVSQSKEELLNQTTLELSKQASIGELNLQSAIEMAHETPVQFESASYAFSALQTRYNTGLTNFSDLIQSQYALVKAESDLKESYWEAWKALLYKAAVGGNLNIFFNELK